MADKQVKVVLAADVRNYVKGMREAAQSTLELERGAENVDKWGGQWAASAELVGGQMLLMGGAAVAGVGMAVNTYSQFEAAMSSVRAATHASAADMELLTEAARDAGASTAFSAHEAASAIEELAKAGVSTADILGGGLDGAMALAAAGALDVGQAAEIAASAMTQFKLSGDEIPHLADLLAAGAGKAQGSVQDLGMALSQAGLVASQMGLSIEETVGGLAAFAAAGMTGSDAGTSFKTMLQRLANPAEEAQGVLGELGISAWDAQGNFVGLSAFAGQLKTAMADLSPEARNAAMSVIFGADAIRAANVLYENGAEGIADWTAQVNDAGYAAETAALMQDNLRGDLEKLGGAWDDLMISLGSGAGGPLRGAVQGLTDFIDALGSMPEPIQALITAAAGIGGALLLAGGGALVLIPKLVETKNALETLGITGEAVKGKLSDLFSMRSIGVAGAIMGAVAAIALLVKQLDAARLSAEEAQAQIVNAASAFDLLEAAIGTRAWHDRWASDFLDNADLVAAMTEHLGDAAAYWADSTDKAALAAVGSVDKLEDYEDGMRRLGELLAEMPVEQSAAAFEQLRDQYKLTDDQMVAMLDKMPALRDEWNKQAAGTGIVEGALDTYEEKLALIQWAMDDTAGQSAEMTAELEAQEQAAADAAQAHEDLYDAIKAVDDLMAARISGELGYYDALDKVNGALEENGSTLDKSTKAGRDNWAALLDLAGATSDYAAEVFNMTGSQAAASQIVADGRDEFLAMAEQMGMTAEQAEYYADKLFQLPESVVTAVHDGGTIDATSMSVDALDEKLAALPANTNIQVTGLTEDAMVRLEQLGYTVTTLPDGTIYVSTSGVDEVEAQLSWLTRPQYVTLSVLYEEPAYGPLKSGYKFPGAANGGLHEFANGGGFPTGIYRGGTPILKFAEPETRWEAFISGRPGQEQRNIAIALEALRRLGHRDAAFANGGMRQYESTPVVRIADSRPMSAPSYTWSPQITMNAAEATAAELVEEMRREKNREMRRLP